MNYLPNYVYELVLAGQTIRIFNNEKKANEVANNNRIPSIKLECLIIPA